MHQIRFRLELRLRPRWGAYSALLDLLAVFKGPTSKGREGWKDGREWQRRWRKEGEGTYFYFYFFYLLIFRNL